MTNEEIQKHIETNCRSSDGWIIMDEQTFYEGAKWYRDDVAFKQIIELKEEKKKLEFMIENGLGFEDMEKM